MEVNHASAMEKARAFIAKHLAECCEELIEWDTTALLRNGKVREAASIYKTVSSNSALSMVRSEVALQAMTELIKFRRKFK